MAHPGFPTLANDPGSDSPHALREYARKTARAVNGILSGKINAILHVTLTANAASTTITDARLSAFSFFDFDPLTANAAAEKAAGTLYVTAANRRNGQATITHANAATVDREFLVAVFG